MIFYSNTRVAWQIHLVSSGKTKNNKTPKKSSSETENGRKKDARVSKEELSDEHFRILTILLFDDSRQCYGFCGRQPNKLCDLCKTQSTSEQPSPKNTFFSVIAISHMIVT